MTARTAIRYAWLIWVIAVSLCAAAVGTALAGAAGSGSGNMDRTRGALIFSVLVFIVLIPGAFAAHWTCFRRFWSDGYGQPRGYLIASVLLWSGLTLSVVLGSIATLTHGLMHPNIVLVLIGMLLVLLTWPNGWAMIERRRREDEDDEEVLHLPHDAS